MRLACSSLVLLAALAVSAGAQASPPPSASNLLRLHPAAWQLPAAPGPSAMRFEPETGEKPAQLPLAPGAVDAATLRARAAANVRTLGDGSRHAVLNGALRAWTVATIDDQGRLVQDCVHDEAQARQRIEAADAARKQGRK
jgi:hypothetical protein